MLCWRSKEKTSALISKSGLGTVRLRPCSSELRRDRNTMCERIGRKVVDRYNVESERERRRGKERMRSREEVRKEVKG